MKKGLLFSIIAFAAIIIVASFHMQLGNVVATNIPESLVGNILYVCPAADSTWDMLATSFRPFTNYIIAGFFFALVLLTFGWGWQLYQNLLSDKFKRESFKNIWGFTKIWFWGAIIAAIVLITPNTLRRVEITGISGDWILCNASDVCDTADPNCHTRVVRADAVHAR